MIRVRMATRSALSAFALVAAIGAAPAAVAQSVAEAPHEAVSCGETITESIVVTNDLTCNGTALDIEASGVVLDLDGHTVSGDGQGAGVVLGLGQPVQLTGDEVENGTIENMAEAVYFGYVITPVLSHLSISGCGSGGAVFYTNYAATDVVGYQILDSRVTTASGDYLMNAGLEDSSGFTVKDSVLNGGQIYLSQTDGPLLEHDTFTNVPMTFNNEGDVRASDSTFDNSPINDGPGFRYDNFTDDTFKNAGTALYVWDMSDETFSHDVFTGDGTALSLQGTTNATVTDDVFRNDGAGVSDGGGSGNNTYTGDTFDHLSGGLNVYSSGGETISGNSFTNDGLGMYMEYPASETVTDNRFINDAMFGLYAWERYPGPPGSAPIASTFSGNVAVDDGHQPGNWQDPDGDAVDGAFFIYAPDGGLTAQDNRTTNDGGWGLWTVPDAPGNVLGGNVSVHDANGCNPVTACSYK